MATNWFGIDSTGWRRMNAGRKMGHLIREGISNAFDLDDVNRVKVKVEEGHVVVEDDGTQGFDDPNLIFTVFMTGKEDSHLKRGRKGRGLKELIAAADKASVATPGYTITFDKRGRTKEKNYRTMGTMVDVESSLKSWNKNNVDEAISYLTRIVAPEGINFSVNGQPVQKPVLLETLEDMELETTVVVDDVEKTNTRSTTVHLRKLKRGEKKGWIYEMGIPIQEIDHPFHIDVQQRVPMNDNRDTVKDTYLRNISALVLGRRIEDLSRNDLKKRWVTDCIYWANTTTTKVFAEKMIGPHTVLKTDNKKANDVAKQHGFEVVDVRGFPYDVMAVIEGHIEDAEEVAKRVDDERKDTEISREELLEAQNKFCCVVEWFGKKLLRKSITCKLFSRPADYTGYKTKADYAKEISTIRYNMESDNDFTKPLGQDNISTMIHEFAHEYSSEHEAEFMEAMEMLAGKMAFVILHHHDEIHKLFGPISYMPGKTCFIECVDCGATREIKVQDKFQCKRCKVCQKRR